MNPNSHFKDIESKLEENTIKALKNEACDIKLGFFDCYYNIQRACSGRFKQLFPNTVEFLYNSSYQYDESLDEMVSNPLNILFIDNYNSKRLNITKITFEDKKDTIDTLYIDNSVKIKPKTLLENSNIKTIYCSKEMINEFKEEEPKLFDKINFIDKEKFDLEECVNDFIEKNKEEYEKFVEEEGYYYESSDDNSEI